MASIRVAVTTTGLDPDQDGYQLTIDGVDALALNPMGTVQVNVDPATHPAATGRGGTMLRHP